MDQLISFLSQSSGIGGLSIGALAAIIIIIAVVVKRYRENEENEKRQAKKRKRKDSKQQAPDISANDEYNVIIRGKIKFDKE